MIVKIHSGKVYFFVKCSSLKYRSETFSYPEENYFRAQWLSNISIRITTDVFKLHQVQYKISFTKQTVTVRNVRIKNRNIGIEAEIELSSFLI